MTESLDIDPLLREYLEQRRGLTDDEIDRLLIEWNNQGSLTDFLAGKALLDRTTAKMLITAQKGYLSSSPDELRTVLGVRLKLRLNTNHNAQTAAPHATATETVTEPVIPKTPEGGNLPQDWTPLTGPRQAIAAALSSKETDHKETQPALVPARTAQLQDEPPRARKSTGRRGFLGASDEELRHILGGRATSPAVPSKTEGSGEQQKAPAVTTTPPATTATPPATTATPPATTATPPATTATPPATTALPLSVKPTKLTTSTLPGNGVPPPSDLQTQPSVHSGQDLIPTKSSATGDDPKVGTYLDRYYLEESLGEGATATIFRSFHKLLRIPVAIKCYKREAMKDDPLGAQRFLSEAQILIRLEHPNIVRVLDIAVRDSSPYIVFEYVGELSLQGMINNMGHLPPLRIAQIGAQVAAALDVASSNGLLHRDVKPDNILIRKDGLAKLADFGIATHRASDGRTADELARAGLISGTPQYISPEQITTPDQIDFRADMYSLGATLYHAACGHPPFDRDSIDELLHAQLEDQPISLTSLDPNFDSELSEIIDRMLHKEPSDRFPSLAEIRKRLDGAASRIQGEVSTKRRNALSSGAMAAVVISSSETSPSGFTSEDAKTDKNRSSPQAKKKSSETFKSLPTDGQLLLREPSNTLRAAVVVLAMMMAALMIYVLIRTAH